jgi:hypothetical protein
MHIIDLLRHQSDIAFKEMLDAIDGVSEHQSWAKIECQPGEYLNSEGSIISTVMHVASGKFLYGSAAYRGLEVRWRDTIDRLTEIWPHWEAAKAYLMEAHEYWRASWADEVDFERLVKNFRNVDVPSWKIISTLSHHDSYHAGQIQLLRSVLPPSAIPPPDESDLWRQACENLPSW